MKAQFLKAYERPSPWAALGLSDWFVCSGIAKTPRLSPMAELDHEGSRPCPAAVGFQRRADATGYFSRFRFFK